MDYSQYENYGFDRVSAFNLSTGYEARSYQAHWHSYGEILLVGPGKTNVFRVNQSTYELVEGDFLLMWPMEVHEIIDADRKESLVIQFSNTFINSLFDLQRIMHFYRNLHVLCINAHPELVGRLRVIADKMKEIWFEAEADRELRCCMLLMEFMLTLDRYRDEFVPELRGGDTYSYTDTVMRRMMTVTDYIKNNLTADDLSQAAMAERAGISKNPEKLMALVKEKTETAMPTNIVKSPYVFDFLGLKSADVVEESDLETLLISHIQEFILELGEGFCFEGRQKRILIDDEYFFVDLVFYHRILKCHVLVELKTKKFNYADMAQLNMYVAYYRDKMMAEGDNAPIGILLCTDASSEMVRYATAGMDENLFVSKYLLQLPAKETFVEFLNKEMKEL